MKLNTHLNLNQRVLKVVGFNWNAEKLKFSQILFTFPTLLIFCSSLVLTYLDPRQALVSSNIDSQVFHLIYHTRTLLFLTTLIVHISLSLFHRRSERLKFFEAFVMYDKIVEKHIIERNLMKEQRRAKIIMGASILYHLVLLVSFTILEDIVNADLFHIFIDYPRDYIYVLGEFFIFQNQSFLNSLMYSMSKQLKATNKGILNKKLKPQKILLYKLKLFKIINLFNRSFGLLVLFEVFRSFINLTSYLYLIIAKIVVNGAAMDLMWLLVTQINNLGTNLASCKLFHESQKLKTEESFTKVSKIVNILKIIFFHLRLKL